MDPIAEGLDPDQREAVFKEARHILVAAAPGSGKTRVLTSRFARIISAGVSPSAILAVTFTNRAAFEMRSRVTAMTGWDASFFNIGTFHGFCLKFLKRTRPGFILCGRERQLRLLRDLGIRSPESALSRISALKNLPGLDASPDDLETAALYRKGLDEINALDLDDLILETIKTLESGPAVNPAHFDFSHIMVDEYQDINLHQGRLIKLLAGKGASLFCIGDPDQAIYAFRGANIGSFVDFAKDHAGAHLISLGKNYRSGGIIVSASRAVIENNVLRIKNEISPARDGGEIEIVECDDERQEAEFIVREIESLMGGFSSLTVSSGGHTGQFRISDFAVLFRTNRQASALTEAFGRSSVPFHVVGPTGPDFLDFIEHLKTRSPGTDIKLNEFIKAEGEGLDKDLLDTFIRAAEVYGSRTARESLQDFLEEMLLTEPSDNCDIIADKASLLTLHAAKGLEFGVVFIAGVEEGLIPFRLKDGSCYVEEERRLFYVGMTRAKEKLYLLSSHKRRTWGEALECKASPFLEEIPESLLSRRVLSENKKAKRKAEQKGLFD